MLDYTTSVVFPPLSLESEAINVVKKAILTVPDKGRSAKNIQENVKWFMTMPGLSPGRGWIAKAEQGKTYTVTYDFIDGKAGSSQAIWSVDLGTKKVRYINQNAKLFSWAPRD